MYHKTSTTMGMIILNFPPKTPREEKNQLIESVNNQLNSINSEVNSWNGFVDVVRSENSQYKFIGKCDNEEVRRKMQSLLDILSVTLPCLLTAL